MTVAKRVGLILAVALLWPLVLMCQGLASHLADALLPKHRELLSAWPHLSENLSGIFLLVVECLPLLIWKHWRDIGSFRFRWSWTVLVPTLCVVLHLIGFGKLPAPHPWLGSLDLLWFTLLISANEELIFRGYLFHDRPEAHPKVTVLCSSLAFALVHYVNLSHQGTNLHGVTVQVCSAFCMGLGLGTVRLATGSLGWCILVHWLGDAAFFFNAMGTPRSVLGAVIFVPLWLLLTLIVFGVHPALRLAPASGAPLVVPTVRVHWLRRSISVCLGLLGGLALLSAVAWPFVRWQALPPPSLPLVGGLVVVALSSLVLAFAVVRWPRWRALPGTCSAPPLSTPDPTPPKLRIVRLGSALLCYVSMLTALWLTTFCLNNFNVSLPPPTTWQILRVWLLLYGAVAATLVPPFALALFSLRRAIVPLVSSRTRWVWTGAAVFQIYLIWLGARVVRPEVRIPYGLKFSLWNLGWIGLLLSVFLGASQSIPRRRSTPALQALGETVVSEPLPADGPTPTPPSATPGC